MLAVLVLACSAVMMSSRGNAVVSWSAMCSSRCVIRLLIRAARIGFAFFTRARSWVASSLSWAIVASV
ncbi:hypothetical protein BST28_21795 [Mycolicibacter kumamotonensis]|uniref:Secreted protein n=1 Tax=Mycolicibacter kumamotonensis TaxID=354243 RepID=A0A1X0DSZ2_9MYCO|nr:hypothetical protein BST28_21795 [Mycolicibacter kumamotonensis]